MENDESTLAMAKQEANSVDVEAQAIESLVNSVPHQMGGDLPVHASFKQMFPYASGSDSTTTSRSSSSGTSSSEESGALSERFVKKMLKNMKLMAERDDPEEDQKLAEALNTIKSQIVFKAKTIKESKEWVKKVTKLVDVYVKKVRRVHAHATGLLNEYALLLRKKKQVENMILQRLLEKRLKMLQGDLKVIHGALENIQGKQTIFSKSKTDIKVTIGAMEDFLTRLRNKRGDESSEESSSSQSSSSESSSQSSSSQSSSKGSSQSSGGSSQSRSGSSSSSASSSSSKKGQPKPKPSRPQSGSSVEQRMVKLKPPTPAKPQKMQTLSFSFSEVNPQDDPNELS